MHPANLSKLPKHGKEGAGEGLLSTNLQICRHWGDRTDEQCTASQRLVEISFSEPSVGSEALLQDVAATAAGWEDKIPWDFLEVLLNVLQCVRPLIVHRYAGLRKSQNLILDKADFRVIPFRVTSLLCPTISANNAANYKKPSRRSCKTCCRYLHPCLLLQHKTCLQGHVIVFALSAASVTVSDLSSSLSLGMRWG